MWVTEWNKEGEVVTRVCMHNKAHHHQMQEYLGQLILNSSASLCFLWPLEWIGYLSAVNVNHD